MLQGRTGAPGSVAHHAVLKIRQPGVGCHFQIHTKTLDFEITEVEPFGSVDAAKNHPDGTGRMAGPSQSEIPQAMAHSMPRAIVKTDGCTAHACVGKCNDVAREPDQKHRLVFGSEDYRDRKGCTLSTTISPPVAGRLS
jgi:hypothetical protein